MRLFRKKEKPGQDNKEAIPQILTKDIEYVRNYCKGKDRSLDIRDIRKASLTRGYIHAGKDQAISSLKASLEIEKVATPPDSYDDDDDTWYAYCGILLRCTDMEKMKEKAGEYVRTLED